MTDTPPAVEPEAAAEAAPAEEAPQAQAAPEAPPADERSTEEILANAPPLVLPEGTTMVKQCPQCGLKLEDPPAGLECPNCGTTIP